MKITYRLDSLSTHLESLGMIKEAHDLDVVSNTLEAGAGQWIRGIVSKIPGLPSKEEALKIVLDFAQTSPGKLEVAINEIAGALGGNSMVRQASNKEAFNLQGLMRGVKTITNPKVILAIIALMGVFQTADAGKFKDAIQKERLEWQALKQDTADTTAETPTKKVSKTQVLGEVFGGSNPIVDEFLKQKPGRTVGSVEVVDSTYGRMTFGVGMALDSTGGAPGYLVSKAQRRAKLYESFVVVSTITIRIGDGLAVVSISQNSQDPRSSMVPQRDYEKEIKENAADILQHLNEYHF
jgi:hypothetical protein